MDWTDKTFTTAWGKTNKESAKHYEASIDKLQKTSFTTFMQNIAEMKAILANLKGNITKMIELALHR